MLTDKQLQSLGEVQTALKKIAEKRVQSAEDRETLKRLETAVLELNRSNTPSADRAGEFEEEQANQRLEALAGNKKMSPQLAAKAFDSVLRVNTRDPDIKEAQEHMDRCYIMSTALQTPVTNLKYFWDGLKDNKWATKTMNVSDVQQTLTATGWQPAVFSQQIIEKVKLRLTVAGLHSRFAMPTDPYRFPVAGNEPSVYAVSERGDADDDLTANKRVPVGLTQTGASNLVMSASKLGTRVVLSNELDEDSFLPIVSMIESDMVVAMAEAQDNVTVNGDSAGTLDDGPTGTDPRVAWKGYRKFLSAVSTASVNSGGGLTIDISKLREVRQKMGKYAINPRDVVWVCGPIGYIKLLSLSAGSHESPVQTIDKYGSAATIVTGELARVDGIPIIVTEFMGPGGGEMLDLDGSYNGNTTTFTELLLVRPSAMIYGDRRVAQLRRQDLPVTDQQQLIILQRLTFMNKYPSAPVVGGLYNILKG